MRLRIFVYFASPIKFFSTEAKMPATNMIMPCPRENKNSIMAAQRIFALIVAVAIIPANIGVEQGVVAKANTKPNKKG